VPAARRSALRGCGRGRLSHRGVAACWPGHSAMGRHGSLASGPCHLNFSLNFKISTNFVFQIGDLTDVQNLPKFAGR
jgi:hypothetical protein